MSVNIIIDWTDSTPSSEFELAGEFSATSNDDGVIDVHTDEETIYINASEIRMLRVGK